MKPGSFKVINSLAILPLALLFAIMIVSGLSLTSLDLDQWSFITPLVLIVMIGYYAVPTIGIPYIILWAISIALGWRTPHLSIKQKVLLTIYSITAMCHLGYTLWWYGTSQKFSYL